LRNRQQFSLIRIENDILDPFIAILRVTFNIKQLWDWQYELNYNYSQAIRDKVEEKGYEEISSLVESICYKSNL
jgi:hypothetical protein